MVSMFRKFTDPNELVEVTYTLSGQGPNHRWRWTAYSKDPNMSDEDKDKHKSATGTHYTVFRCMGPPRGFATHEEAVTDVEDLLHVSGE